MEELDGYLLSGTALRFDCHGIFPAQGFAELLLASEGVNVADLKLVDPEGAGAELLGDIDQLFVEAGHDGGDGNDRSGADEDAQNGQEGAELVRAEGVESQGQVLAQAVTGVDRHGFLNSPSGALRWGRGAPPCWRDKYRKTARPPWRA